MSQMNKKSAVDATSIEDEMREVQVFKTFDDMGMSQELLRGVYTHGFETPTHIQERAIVPCMSGHDVIVQAQSGMGKTATFAIGLLHQLDVHRPKCQAIVLSPTGILAEQTYKCILELSKYIKGIKIQLCIGGSQYERSVVPHVVVATPGRMLDLLTVREGQRTARIDVSSLQCFVLDEADELLSLGFEESIASIFKLLPYDRDMQSLVVSATLGSEALALTGKFMRPDPIRILMKERELSLAGIRQFYVQLDQASWKYDCLKDIFDRIPAAKSIIFVNSKKFAEELATRLSQDDFTVSCLHGDLPKDRQRAVVDHFRTTARVLIATNLVGRGFDVQQVQLVINYELPREGQEYVHRIGRCGRKGRKGIVINLVTEPETRDMSQFIRTYDYEIEEMPDDIMRHFNPRRADMDLRQSLLLQLDRPATVRYRVCVNTYIHKHM